MTGMLGGRKACRLGSQEAAFGPRADPGQLWLLDEALGLSHPNPGICQDGFQGLGITLGGLSETAGLIQQEP